MDAEEFARAVLHHHQTLLTGSNKEIRDAVIVKSVALVALAFGIPPVPGEPLDTDDAIEKLRNALDVIAKPL